MKVSIDKSDLEAWANRLRSCTQLCERITPGNAVHHARNVATVTSYTESMIRAAIKRQEDRDAKRQATS